MTGATPTDDTDAIALLERFEPILRFTEGELFLPADIDDYLACCDLIERGPDDTRTVIVPSGHLDAEQLAAHGIDHPRPGQFLRFVDEPFSRRETARWRARRDRPRFHNASRLARVGVMSRGIDALSRASLMVRGKVVNGTQAAAETQYRTKMRADHHPYYGRVLREDGYTVLQYWFFYVFNDWRSRVYGVNDHEADWEQVTIYLVEDDASHGLQPAWIAASAHDEVGDDLRRCWDDPDLSLVGEHPVIHPGLGSHSGALLAGEYLTAYDGKSFARLLRWSRRVSHTLLPWTREHEHSGLSIPYIDYSRGDGVAIGPGGDRPWDPVLVDESTPWLMHYRGLWGNDTHDPLGGERGPAGPRYERSGAVRASWGDPIGWANLRKVPPDRRRAKVAVEARLAELDEEIATLSRDIDVHTTRSRALMATGDSVPTTEQQTLTTLSNQRTARRDERALLERGLERPMPTSDPHDHLHHRRMPLPAETRSRRRMLAIWSALSTSAILGLAAAMLIRPGWTVASFGTEAIVLLFTIEALARRQFIRFAVLIAVLFAIASVMLVVAHALIGDWRLVVAVALTVVAAALVVINLRELLRD